MPPTRRKILTPEEMLAQLSAGVKKQVRTPNIHAYLPHEKQIAFHQSLAKKRLYIGGNRSGKTTAGVAEGIWYLRGDHPYKRVYEPPIQARVIGVDFKRGVKSILIPQYKRWMPASLLKQGSWDRSFDNDAMVLTLTNGSTLEFMSYEQDTDKFAGVPRHITHYDEEPPRHIYNECQARLIDYNGDAWFTMTPVEGMTWVYEELYEPAIMGKTTRVFVIEADMTDNPHINPQGVEEFLAGLDEDERKQREHGQFVSLGGLIFKKFKPEIHVKSYEVPPLDWQWFTSMDHGWNNPTCWLWHAVSPDGYVQTFWEEYSGEMTIAEWAQKYKDINKAFGREPDICVGDPAIKQHTAVTGTSIQYEYAKYGVYIMDGNNDVAIGVNQMQSYLKPHPVTGIPRWQITDNCKNLIREMQRIRWATWAGRKAQYENNPQEKIHKKNDHAPDSARYFFVCLPTLEPDPVPQTIMEELERPLFVRYDEALAGMSEQATRWDISTATSDLYALENENG